MVLFNLVYNYFQSKVYASWLSVPKSNYVINIFMTYTCLESIDVVIWGNLNVVLEISKDIEKLLFALGETKIGIGDLSTKLIFGA